MKLFTISPESRFRQIQRPGLILLSLLGLCLSALAQDRPLRVARVSLIEGEINYQRANDAKTDWFDATLNLPLDENDQLYSGPNGRAEIQLSGRNIVRISRDTNLRFTQFTNSLVQLALPVGTATFRIHSLDKRQFDVVDANDPTPNDPVYFEVDTPTVAVTFVREGEYRINVRDDGSTEVIVRQGQAEVYNQELGTIVVKKGRRAIIEGQDFYQLAKLEDKDNWDRWNDRRDDELVSRISDSNRGARYVPSSIAGVYDLDYYGDWIETPEYGWVWSPRGVAGGWAPYRAGYWRWHPGYGWTWISNEPWGWVPYHYGRWAYWRSRWCWTPYVNVGFGYDWGWRPHLVTFFGWGRGGYRAGVRDGYRDGYRDGVRDARWDYVGWCPMGPRDRHHDGRALAGRSVNSLDNYNAPGGVSTMDGRRFDNGRAVVTQEELRAPAPRRTGAKEEVFPSVVRNDELKPTQAMPTRNPLAERGEVARRLETPVVARRPIDPSRSLDNTARPARNGEVTPGAAPARNSAAPADSAPTRISNGEVVRPERPARAPEYRPVERTSAPVWRAPESNADRSRPSREVSDSPAPVRIERREPDASMPSRESAPPTRTEPRREEAPRRYDPPPPRRVDPPRESTPSRDSMPSRSNDRPASPPQRESPPPPPRESAPARESAPQRAPERPSSPAPSRESMPERSRPGRPDSN